MCVKTENKIIFSAIDLVHYFSLFSLLSNFIKYETLLLLNNDRIYVKNNWVNLSYRRNILQSNLNLIK